MTKISELTLERRYPSSIAAGQAFEGIYFARKKRKNGRLAPRGNPSPIPPQEPDHKRRLLLKAGLLGGGIMVAGGATRFVLSRNNESVPTVQPVETAKKIDPYKNWERYKNSSFLSLLVIEMGRDIEADTEFPGFAEVGTLIRLSQEHPEQLQEYYPLVVNRIDVRLRNLVQEAGAIGSMDPKAKGITEVIKIGNKKTGQIQEGVAANIQSIDISVSLTNSFYLAPDIAKKLILVKEFSHLLYSKEQRQRIFEEFQQNYDLLEPIPEDLSTYLYLNAQGKDLLNKIPPLSDLFDHARVDLDGAGYWHIMRAFGKMRRKGMFTQQDLQALSSDNFTFEEALKRGLLIEKVPGGFEWKQGIGPFSPEWLAIIRQFLR